MAHVPTVIDRRYMEHALQLAQRGLYTTSPNPRVGCVIVANEQIVGEGFHVRAGEAHAETHALDQAGPAARGATAYVTLEPCCHTGRTQPCVDQLIGAGIVKVVAAMRDPNPQVAGKGFARLRCAGIDVVHDVLADEARELNLGFISRMERGRPWLRLKAAASLDGKTALLNGKSQWITQEEARLDGHRFRARACAILTGIGTVRSDDPLFSVRLPADETPPQLRQPLKIVIDPRLEISPQARLFAGAPVLIVSTQSDPDKIAPLAAVGAEVLSLPLAGTHRVDFTALFAELARRKINEVHIEAGCRLNGSLAETGLIDEYLFYLAPTILGDAARGLFCWPALTGLHQQKRLHIVDLRRIGRDIRLLARPEDTRALRAGWNNSPSPPAPLPRRGEGG